MLALSSMNADMNIDRQTANRTFSRIAALYDQHAALQAAVGERLLERLDEIRFQPQRILDLGCGTGIQSQALKDRFPDAAIVAMDLVLPMLRQAGKRRGWWKKRFEPVVGNAMQLPLASSTFDLVHSNLMLQWCDDIESALANLRRVLKPGGLLLVSTLGPDTLNELRRAGTEINKDFFTGHLTDVQRLGSALTRAGFAEPVLDTDWLTTTYATPSDLLKDLECSGAIQATGEGQQDPGEYLNRQELVDAYQSFCRQDGHYPATWEIVYASAWSPDEGQPIRTGQGEEASISVASLKVRKR